jgi:hypothetical protein
MIVQTNFLKRSRKVIFTDVVLFIIPLMVLVAAGCLSPSENKTAVTIPTTMSQVSTTITPASSTNTITQRVTQNSSLLTGTITKKATSAWATNTRTSGSNSHFYIVSFDAKPVSIQQNETYRIIVNMNVVNWKLSGGCAGDNCSDNLNTILIKLNIIGYPGKEIKFNSFGGGGEPKGSADIHVGYEIRDLPVGRYTLEFSTPDSVVRKDIEVL